MILKSCIWKPVTFSGVTPRTRPEPVHAAVLHTNGFAGPASLYAAYASRAASGSTEVAHIQIALDGTAEQYADTKLILGLSWDANDFSVGIESQDGGVPAPPWTQAQLDKIDAILRELGVPARGLPENGSGGGVGYHSKFASWNQSGHTCPGPARVAQVPGIIARLAGTDQEDDDMATTDDDYEQRAFTWGQLQRWQGKKRPTKSPNLKPDKPDENFLDPAQRGWDQANGDAPPALAT